MDSQRQQRHGNKKGHYKQENKYTSNKTPE